MFCSSRMDPRMLVEESAIAWSMRGCNEAKTSRSSEEGLLEDKPQPRKEGRRYACALRKCWREILTRKPDERNDDGENEHLSGRYVCVRGELDRWRMSSYQP